MFLILLDAQPQASLWQNPLFLAILGMIATFLVGFAGGIYTWRISVKQRILKEISYQFLEDIPIVSIDKRIARIGSQAENRLKVTFDDKPVENLKLFWLKVWNSGTMDVEIWNSIVADATHRRFEKPLRFEFPGRKVVGGTVETNPPDGLVEDNNLAIYNQTYLTLVSDRAEEISPAPARDFVELPECLLRPSQSISLRLLLIGPKSEPKGSGKLIDGNVIEFDPDKQPALLRIGVTLLFLLFSIAVVWFFLLGLLSPITLRFLYQPTDLTTSVRALVSLILCVWLLIMVRYWWEFFSRALKNGWRIKP